MDRDRRKPVSRRQVAAKAAVNGTDSGATRGGRPESPCSDICTLDDNNCCLGCHRTLDEIVRWSTMSSEEQWTVIDAVATRKSDDSG